MESSTKILRRLLDERGVEWTEGIARPELTQVRVDGKVVKFHPWQPNTLKVSLFDLTPEQAIAAALGPLTERTAKDSEKDSDRCGTCRAEETDTWECVCDQIGRYGKKVTIHIMECSACGQTFEHVNGAYEYCPHCRRRLVIE